ncbi:MAG TPA: PAS domain S-box protein [Chitinophagaceae bacterium]|nr:PAS domain S-box protein [Chitinophagaceae bacterium]
MRRFHSLRNLNTGLVASLVIIIFFGFLSFTNLRKANHHSRLVNHTLQSLKIMKELMDDVQEIEAGARGYVISADTSFLKTYYSARLRIGTDTSELNKLLNTYGGVSQAQDRLFLLISRKIAFADSSVNLVKQNRQEDAFRQVSTGYGKGLMDSIRQYFLQIENKETAVLQNSNSGRQRAAAQIVSLFIVLGSLFLVLLFLLYWKVRIEIVWRKKNEDKLAYMAGLVNRATDAIISLDTDGRILSWNDGAEKILGYKTDDAIGNYIYALNDSDFDINRFNEVKEAVLAYGSVEKELVSKTKQGNIIQVLASISTLKNEDGQLSGFVAIVKDITQRKNAEIFMKQFNQELAKKVEEKTKEIQREEEKLMHVLNSAAGEFYVIDTNFEVVLISKEASLNLEKAWGNPVVTGSNIIGKMPESRKDSIVQNFREVFRGKEIEYERELIIEGKKRFVVVNYLPVRGKSGEITGACVITKDITEKKISEIHQWEYLERLNLIGETTNDAVWEWNFETGKLWGNKNHQALYGLSVDDPVPSVEEWIKRIHPDEREKIVQSQSQAIHSGSKVFITEYRFSVGNKGYRNIYDRCYILRDKAGNPVRMMGSMMDVTESKKADEAIRKTQETQRLIMNSALDAIVGIDTSGKIIIWTTQAERIFGWKEEEVKGKTLSGVLMPERFAALHTTGMERYLKTGKHTILNKLVETVALHKNGKEFPIELSIIHISHETQEFFCAFIRDITERKKTEIELKDSEEKYRTLVQQAAESIFLLDLNGNYIDANDNATILTGYSLEEIKRMNVRELIAKEDLEKNPLKLEETKKGGSVFTERLIKRKDNTLIDVEVSAKLLSNGMVLSVLRDITEKKKVIQAIKESEFALNEAQRIAHIGSWYFDRDGKIIWSDETYRLYGLDISQKEISRELFFELVYPEDKEKVKNWFNDCIRGNAPGDIIYRTKWNDGTIHYLNGRGELHKDEFNRNYFVRGTVQDVTDRIKYEEELKELNERFQLAIEATKDGVWDWDIKTNNEYFSPQWCRILGYEFTDPELDHTYEAWESRIHPDHLEMVRKALKGHLQQGLPYEVEYLHRHKSGEYRWQKSTGKAVFDDQGKPVRMVGSISDISMRKKAEDDLRKSEKKFRDLLESTPEAMVISDEKGIIVMTNFRITATLGYSREELVGKPVEILIPDLVKQKHVSFRNGYVTKQSVRDNYRGTGLTAKKKDGSIIPVEISLSPLNTAEGVLISAAIRDITERKLAEQKIMQTSEELRQLSAHLQNIREQERIAIAREIHDELGQQLTVMKMDVSWLNKKLEFQEDHPISKRLKELLSMIDGTVKTVRRISSELRPSLLDDMGLSAAMEWYLDEFSKRVGIATSFKCTDDPLNLPDKIKTGLYRIFQESLTNVARHAEATEVTVQTQLKDGNFIMSIRDNGKGFDRNTIKAKRTLGILGMEERSAMIGGSYRIDSEQGKGTTILISVPIKDVN